MSLINEALKRTQDGAGGAGAAAAEGAPDYRVHYGSNPRGTRWPVALLAIGLTGLAVLVTTGYLAWHLGQRTQSLQAFRVAPQTAVAPVPASEPAPPSAPAPVPVAAATAPTVTPPTAAAEPKPAPPAATAGTAIAVVPEKEKVSESPAAKPAPPPAPELPKLVLQGITRDATSREAMINGHTIHEGEDVEGARVVAIEKEGVKLQFAGRGIFLRLY